MLAHEEANLYKIKIMWCLISKAIIRRKYLIRATED